MKTQITNILRRFLRLSALRRSRARLAGELLDLFRTHGGHSAARPRTRADAYEERC